MKFKTRCQVPLKRPDTSKKVCPFNYFGPHLFPSVMFLPASMIAFPVDFRSRERFICVPYLTQPCLKPHGCMRRWRIKLLTYQKLLNTQFWHSSSRSAFNQISIVLQLLRKHTSACRCAPLIYVVLYIIPGFKLPDQT